MTFDRLREFEPVGIAAVGPEPSAMISANANSGWIKRLIPLLSTRRTAFIVALIAALVAMVSATLIPRVIMLAIDNAVVDDSSSLAPYLVALGGLAIVRAFLTKHYRSTLFRVAYDLEYDLRVTMHAHFLRLGLAYFDRVQAGQLISRANSDIRSVQMYLTFAPLLFLSIASFAVGIGLMLSIHVALTLASLITLPFTFLAGRRLRNLTFPLSWIVQGRAADLASIVDENIQGVRVVRSFAAEQRELESLARAAQKLRWAQIVAADARARWGPVIENLPRLGLVVVLLYGGQLAIDGVVTVGGLIAFNAYVLLIQAPFRMLPFVLILGQRAAASAGRIFEVLDEPPTIVDAAGAVDLQAPNGVVEFNHVTFSYADRDAHILDDFSLSIPEGQIVAIVGRTGSGKSTIARILARFYDIDSGTITIDAQNIEACTLVSVRHAVAVVSDEPFLFSDSIHKNIAFARPNATRADVIAAAKAAQADGFITALGEGYDAVVGERGYDLSGGQRQRIALARALLADPLVLVLDDATSAIDVGVEALIHDALKERRGGRTTIVIAHRLSTISLADRVVLLEAGRVIADDSHQHLLATEPKYAAVLTTLEPETREVVADGVRHNLTRTTGAG